MAAKSDRRADVRALLMGVELTPETFLERAFTQPEIEFVEIFATVAPGYTLSSRRDRLSRGFDAASIEEHILGKFGPGRYCIRPVIDGEFVTNKFFTFGNVVQSEAGRVGDHTAVTGGTALDEATNTLKTLAAQNQLRGIIADQQAGDMQKEMLPLKMMGEVLTAHSTALKDMMQARAASGAGDGKLTEILLAQLATMQQTVFRLLEKPAPVEKPMVSELGEQVKAIAEVARLLGFERGDGLPVVQEKGFWTPEGLATMFEAARPFIADIKDSIMVMASGRGPAPVPVPAVVPGAVVVGPERAGTGGKGMGLDLEEDDKELLHVGIEALRSRDFPTVRVVLTEIVQQYHIPFDVKANPEVYVVMLRRVAPEIVNLRAEFKDFLRWMEEEAGGSIAKEVEGDA